MSVASIGVPTFGSAAIATPPANKTAVKRDDRAESSSAQQVVEAAKSTGTGQIVDKTV